jgi:predicted TIM-barrel fold metal-dependent hydrolase
MDGRQYLRSASGLPAAFTAMNMVYGPHFRVDKVELSDPDESRKRAGVLADQFVFDDQLHFVHDRYRRKDVLLLREHAKMRLNPELKGEKLRMSNLRIHNFFKEVFLESDTKVGILTSATADKLRDWFLSNEQIAAGARKINEACSSRKLLTHAMFTPGYRGWMDEIDRLVTELKPAAWKGYPVGDPFHFSRHPYRLDDEELLYPAYEKFEKAGIRNVCIHKGLMPLNFLKDFANWKYGSVDDVPKAAKEWPGLNFIIYHAAFRPSLRVPRSYLKKFEKTGRIPWVDDLAEIPAKHGVKNVYADIGTTFGVTAVLHPGLAAAILGTLIKGLGEDHILWGTDSVYHGSPQWQIEALRRIEIPEEMQRSLGFSALGGPRSRVKEKILGRNAAILYGIDPRSPEYRRDGPMKPIREAYREAEKKEVFLKALLQ